MSTLTATPANLDRLARLEAADAKKLASSKANLQTKYGLTKAEAETAHICGDLPLPKIKVTYACRCCGKTVSRYTSDLFVPGVGGKAIDGKVRDCQDCLSKNKKDDKADMKALQDLRAKAKQMGVEVTIDGKINPVLIAKTEDAE